MLLVLFLGILSVVNGAPDNRGTEFVIAYMDNYLSTYDLELFVTTSRTTTVTVTVTSPKWTNPSINEQFTVIAGVVKQLFIDLKLRLEGTVKESKGILVSATDEVVIYGVNKQSYSNDAFLGLPTDVLGSEYYSVTYYPPYRRAQLCVVGVTDNTQVSIKLASCSSCGKVTYGGTTYNKGQTLTVTLNRFDAIQLQSTGDLTGAYITSNHPVSTFSGNRKTKTGSGGSQDHLVEQLTPVDTWGKKFATVPTPARTTGDYYKIIASEDSTSVTYKCNKNNKISTNTLTLSTAGSFTQISIDSKAYCYFNADKAILLVMIVKSQLSSSEPADPAMIIIPPIEQYAADYTFTTPKYSRGSYANFFMFVVNKNEKDGLRLDGAALPANTAYVDIPDTDYVAGYTTVTDGSHTMRHNSPISIFGGFLYGKAPYETYGFTTGIRMAPINTVCVPSATVVGDGIDNDCDGLIDEELCTVENKNADDDGDGVSEEDCATPPPIDGNWASWNSWASCSVTCKDAGTNPSGTWTRQRTCTDPTPKYDGKQCVGSGSASSTCSPTVYCPVDGNWGSWSSYGSCSVTCGSGTQTKTRSCSNPAPAHSGRSCSGSGTDSKACTLSACPVDGNWASWASWGSCSVTCASGTLTRTRSCSNPAPANGGASCSGSGSEDKTCSLSACPVDGNWGSWLSWGSCSVTCASGTQTKTRSCSSPAPAHGGASCSGSGVDTKTCTLSSCPVDGNWASWASWGSCSVTCASGTLTRTRSCSNPAPANGGASCSGSGSEDKTCSLSACPVDGNWGSWLSWGSCSVTCASGTQTKTRSCSSPAPAHGGASCSGSGVDTKTCTLSSCPVDGNWASWASWGSCSVTCASGTLTRTRSCSNPAPAYGGASCSGSGSEDKTCSFSACPVDGNWGSWLSWGSCSVTCASGTQTKTRSCSSPAPAYGGASCSGSGIDTKTCTLSSCPVDGNWGSWTSWGSCSVTCASGTQTKSRSCSNPAPAHGGASCSGSTTDTQTCAFSACPVDGNWGSWASWGSCSVTCASGLQEKSRSCSNPAPAHGGASCGGSNVDTKTCTLSACPIDGNWGSWTSWGTCSVTCATGTHDRSRTCSNPAPNYGGANCGGSASQTQTCTLNPCPIDGNWATWTTWSTCTVTCGGGSQDRSRTCTNPSPQHGGANCPNSGSETQSCSTQSCIIDGEWGQWGTWGVCSVTCAGGYHSRSRVCDDPRPQNGGLPCSGVSSDFGYCNTQACPTAAAGAYVQKCPTGWFTCQSGSITCIDESFVCDCASDCEDGSEETLSYASCNPLLLASCPSGAKRLTTLSFGSFICLLATIWMFLMR